MLCQVDAFKILTWRYPRRVKDKLISSINWLCRPWSVRQKVMPDDHSDLVPLLPIPNRTVKRVSADDSADSRVKVGHRQAITVEAPHHSMGCFFLGGVQVYRRQFPAYRSCSTYFSVRNWRRNILPTFDLGNSSLNSMYFGRL